MVVAIAPAKALSVPMLPHFMSVTKNWVTKARPGDRDGNEGEDQADRQGRVQVPSPSWTSGSFPKTRSVAHVVAKRAHGADLLGERVDRTVDRYRKGDAAQDHRRRSARYRCPCDGDHHDGDERRHHRRADHDAPRHLERPRADRKIVGEHVLGCLRPGDANLPLALAGRPSAEDPLGIGSARQELSNDLLGRRCSAPSATAKPALMIITSEAVEPFGTAQSKSPSASSGRLATPLISAKL